MFSKDLAPVQSVSKSAEVLQRLRSAIWCGDLAPGTPLREAHLAKQLNVSQVPIREALLKLENLGLVVRVPDHGTTVTKLDRPTILQLMEVRRHLEDFAFQSAISRITPTVEAELRTHLKNMEELVAAKDHFGVAEEDFAFHKTVWRASGNLVLAGTLERLCVSAYAFVSLKRHAAADRMRFAVKAHTILFKALKSGDPEKVRVAIREHLSSDDVIPDSIEK